MVRDYPYNLDETPYQLVRDWLKAFNKPIDLSDPNKDIQSLSIKCIIEECQEVYREFVDEEADNYEIVLHQKVDKEKLTKELCDLIWVSYQAAAFYGLPMEEAFKRVYQSNMSKLDDNGQPILREDGKILKSDNYKPAELGDLFD